MRRASTWLVIIGIALITLVVLAVTGNLTIYTEPATSSSAIATAAKLPII